ncbi:rRNA maturation RNase YbeY, partial [Patescibacteria group bacterium]|nr:rRNA maturation RNase YbeY [Patescibacteria group bacterium]
MIKAELNARVKFKLGDLWLRRALGAANKKIGKKKNYYVSVALVGEARMRSLNEKYRAKSGATDVLSFPAAKEVDGFISPKEKKVFLGEIIICPKVASRQAGAGGCTLTQELQRLFIHGLLHLFGHEHRSAKGRKRMVMLEKRIIKIQEY